MRGRSVPHGSLLKQAGSTGHQKTSAIPSVHAPRAPAPLQHQRERPIERTIGPAQVASSRLARRGARQRRRPAPGAAARCCCGVARGRQLQRGGRRPHLRVALAERPEGLQQRAGGVDRAGAAADDSPNAHAACAPRSGAGASAARWGVGETASAWARIPVQAWMRATLQAPVPRPLPWRRLRPARPGAAPANSAASAPRAPSTRSADRPRAA